MIPEFLRNPPAGKPWLLYGALGASLVLNLLLAGRLGAASPELPEAPVPVVEVAAMGEPSAEVHEPVPADQVAPLPEKRGVARAAGIQVYRGAVSSSLSEVFTRAPGTSPAALTQVFSRLFAWDVDMRRDIHRGDVVEVLYEQPPRGEPLVLAARLQMHPGTDDERVVAVWRYHAPGDRFPSWWDEAGVEVARRLIDGPLEDYEALASRSRDGRTGLDFKSPVGNPVLAPRAGVVKKVDANPILTGKSVELEYPDGVRASFFHLNDVAVKAGEQLVAGTVLGSSGNTGRSTVPHLRYELVRGGKAIDPLDYHGTLRRSLPPTIKADFDHKRAELAEQLSTQVASVE